MWHRNFLLFTKNVLQCGCAAMRHTAKKIIQFNKQFLNENEKKK